MSVTSKKPVPCLFTLAKRFFRSSKIKYFFVGETIITRPHPKFHPVAFSFSVGRVRISPIPINGWSIDVTASTFLEVLNKIEKHHKIFNK